CISTYIFGQGGILSFWKDFIPCFYRIGPHTILSFIFIEQSNIQYQRHISKKPDLYVNIMKISCSNDK
ncbi:unnamed protein product, partial [Adineta steineri]